ncbi:ankyrin repeat protein [Colletotrichum higginsianum IMI 349063]|uniref:Ankyrin repeat protein n=1 Tax=Colletotrichum higginsianum (strain IMI 349063) TaxID=759273 RepID=A0A1B7XWW1_COLHI|nr:ankyrin repeat protein [Colletotrichum higginsianum IMI 349063]OBR04248.1 ankyrin repeat protein [Colletotrichum higginsianum IMI 349063]
MLSLDLDLAETIPDDELRTVCSLRTPLQAAAERGDNTLLEKLRTLGANINEPPGKNAGVTALQAASIKGYYGLVKRLLDLQADPNAPGAAVSGRTALEGAAEHGRLDVVQLLLNSGVETCGSGRRQYVRAIEFARKECHHIVVKLLRSHRPWTEADQELLKDETLLQWDQTPEGIAKRREELEGHTAQAIDDDETTEYETSEYEDCDDEYSDNETSDDEASKDDAEEASLNRLPASTLEETREVLRIDDETPGLPGDAIWAEAYENWSSEFPWSME